MASNPLATVPILELRAKWVDYLADTVVPCVTNVSA